MSDSHYELRTVHLPLQKLDKCGVCGKSTSLHLCSSCGERIYCSPECQKNEWPEHKKNCGKTDRIDLASFYPFLACLAETAHHHSETPIHPALTHTIVNSPNPGSPAVTFPDGSAANLILLGETIPLTQTMTEAWWPTAISPNVRSKMMCRFACEGYVLPIVTSICIALLAEIYTTTAVLASDSSDGEVKRRMRLGYSSSPLSDFGIAKGSADVKCQDQFAYLNLLDQTFSKGQDPDDHYWIYFTTVRGGEVVLDCAMFTFNMCIMVPADVYRSESLPPFSWAPAFFRDSLMTRQTPELQSEHKRFTALHNLELHRAVEHSIRCFRDIDMKTIWAFMENIAGRKCTQLEKDLVITYTQVNCLALSSTLKEQKWKNWPKTPSLGIEADPGEMDDCQDEAKLEWSKHLKKWNRKRRQGRTSEETLGDAFRAWQNRSAKLPKC